MLRASRLLAVLLFVVFSGTSVTGSPLISGVPLGASGSPPLPDFLGNVIRHRAAQAEAERAGMQAQSAAAAQLEAQLAQHGSWSPPPVQPAAAGRPRKYINLRKRPLTPPQPLVLAAKGARYPRFPAEGLPPPPPPPSPIFFACPSTYSVTLEEFGAKGDGTADDSAALQLASRDLELLYFPPGVYRIATSLTLDKPTYFGTGAQLSVDAGVTLTLTQRPHLWDGRGGIFGGAGRVEMAGPAGGTVQPGWFRRWGESDSDTLQRSIDSCAASCTLLLTRYHSLTKSISLNPSTGVSSSQGALLDGKWGAGQGIVVRPGKYTLPLQFATMVGFSNFALKFQGGVQGAEVQLASIIEGGDGVVFAPEEGVGRRITNVWVTHLTATNSVQNSVVFQGTEEKHLLKNCLVRANFILQGGFLQPDQQSAGLVVRGAVPRLVATSVVFQAVEAAQFFKETKFVFLQNVGSAAAKQLAFQVPAWGGGLVTGGKIMEGEFQGARVLARMSGGVPGAIQFASIQNGKLNNMVTKGAVSSAGEEFVMPNKPRVKQFNGGSPVIAQMLYLRAPIARRWKPGQVRTFYFYNVYAKTVPSSRMRYIPFRAANTGVVLVGFENQHAQQAFRIKVKLKNAAKTLLPSWMTSHRFGVQVGP